MIIFNYDRCIEHFLFCALKTYYKLSEDKTSKLLCHLKIIHPYGTVGSLKWQDKTSSTAVPFGAELKPNQLVNYAQKIRTFTEGAISDDMPDLRTRIDDAERLVFLGFAFHQLNMDLLSDIDMVQYENSNKIKCYATALKSSQSDQDSIASSIQYLFKNKVTINIEDNTCAQLFNNYSRSLGYAQDRLRKSEFLIG